MKITNATAAAGQDEKKPEQPEEGQAKTGAAVDGEGTKPAADEKLGEAGLNALIRERENAREAEKRAKAAEARLRELEDAGKTDAEKREEALKQALAEKAALKALNDRLTVASMTGVPVELLAGPGEDLDAYAKALKEWRGAAASASEAESSKPAPVPTVGSQPQSRGNVPIDAQIADAVKSGDKDLVARLKAMKLGQMPISKS